MKRNILFEVAPLKNGVPVTLRMAAASARSAGTQVDGKQWLPVITQRPTREISLGSDGLLTQVQITHGNLSFWLSPDFDNEEWSSYEWQGATARYWTGNEGQPFSQYEQRFEGTVGSLSREGIAASLELLGPEAQLERDLLSLEYAGTGGIEGPASLKGKLKPRAFGLPLSVEPVLIDPAYWVYQVHGYGAATVSQVYEFAQPLDTESYKGDAADYAALVGLEMVPGEWASCDAHGLFRLGGAPSQKVSADVSAGSSQLSSIARELLLAAGVPSARIGDFSAFNDAQWSLYQTEQVSVGEAVRDGFFQAGGYPLADGRGVWQCGDFFSNKLAFELKADRTTEPLVRRIKQLNAAPPVWKVKIGFDRCWGVHNDTEVSPALAEVGDKIAASEEAIQAAQEAADQAKADVEIAQNRLLAIESDGILDRSEKAGEIQRFSNATAERVGLLNQGTEFDVTTERTAYSDAYDALKTHLEGLSPAYTDLTQDTPLNRQEYDAAWGDWYVARANLKQVLTGTAGTIASWPRVTGAGRPEDNATRGAPAGTTVNGRPVEEVTDDLDTALGALKDEAGRVVPITEILVDVSDLQQTYGGTASAADSAAIAQQAKDIVLDAQQTVEDAQNDVTAKAAQVASDKQSAETAASDAQSYRDSAAISATSADGSASSAAQQAGVATQARQDAEGMASTAGLTPNGHFINDTLWDVSNMSYGPIYDSVGWRSAEGQFGNIISEHYAAVSAGRTYRLTCRFIVYNATQRLYAGVAQYDAQKNYLGHAYIGTVGFETAGTAAIRTGELPFSSLNPATVYVRPVFYANYPEPSESVANGIVDLDYLYLEDVTNAKAAETFASASADSASLASTKANEAGASASAASTARQQSEVARDQSQVAASNSQTYATQASQSAAASQTAMVNAASIGGGFLNRNSSFSDWTGTMPERWAAWNAGGTTTKAQGLVGANAVEQTVPGGGGAYGFQTNYSFDDGLKNASNGYYVVSYDFTVASGTLNGVGGYFNLQNSGGSSYTEGGVVFSDEIDDNTGAKIGAGIVGRRYRITKLVKLSGVTDPTDILFYCMTSWNNLGDVSVTRTIRWHQAGIRRATEQEVAVGRPGVDGLSAQVEQISGALLSTQGRASAYLQSTVNAGSATAFFTAQADSSVPAVATHRWQPAGLLSYFAIDKTARSIKRVTGNTADWSYTVWSDVAVPNAGAYLAFRAGETTVHKMMGLTANPGGSYGNIHRALYADTGGVLRVYEDGTHLGQVSTYTTGDLLSVEIKDGWCTYRKNGTLLLRRATTTNNPSLPWYAIASFYSPGAIFKDVVFGEPAISTSNISIGASEFHVFNPSGGDWKKALSVANGDVQIYGKLQVGAVTNSMLEGTVQAAVAAGANSGNNSWTAFSASVKQEGNAVTCLPGGGGWNSGESATTKEVFKDGAVITGRLSTPGTFLGLAESATSYSPSYGNMAAMWHRSTNGRWYIGWNGWANNYDLGTGSTGVTFTDSTVFSIAYDGTALRFYADGVLIQLVAGWTAGRAYRGRVVFDSAWSPSVPTRVDGLMLTPGTDNTTAVNAQSTASTAYSWAQNPAARINSLTTTIDGGKITTGSVTANQLSSGLLITSSAQIGNGVIKSAQIGNLSVQSAHIEDLTVGTRKIVDNSITKVATYYNVFYHQVTRNVHAPISNGSTTAEVVLTTDPASDSQVVTLSLIIAMNRAGGSDDSVTVQMKRKGGASGEVLLPQYYVVDVQGQNWTYKFDFADVNPEKSATLTYQVDFLSNDDTYIKTVYLEGLLAKK